MSRRKSASLAHFSHLLSGTSFAALIRLVVLFKLSPQTLFAMRAIIAAIILLAPLRVYHSIRYGRAIDRTPVRSDPVFIIGHWRSGTTYFHQLMSQDEQFGTIKYFQAQFPHLAVLIASPGTLLFRYFSRMSFKRPQDNVIMSNATSSEEEFAIVKLDPVSFIAAWAFTPHWQSQFRKFVLMEGLDDRQYRRWQKTYRSVMRTISYLNPGKTLLLKSPYNTGRIQHILRLFPDAKFVYLHRDKSEVIRSTIHMHRTFADFAIMRCPDDELVRNIQSAYCDLEHAYLRDRSSIPEGRLVEVAYRDFVADPVNSLAAIYRRLSLPGFEKARPAFENYVEAQRSYQVNAYE